MSGPDVPSEQPAARYGAPSARHRLVLYVAVGAAAAALSGWLVWAALDAATPDVRSQVLDFQVLDDRQVRATIEVVAERQLPVTCTLRAQDEHHETTGVAWVTSLGGQSDRRVVEAVVKTRERAVAVTVAGCRAARG